MFFFAQEFHLILHFFHIDIIEDIVSALIKLTNLLKLPVMIVMNFKLAGGLHFCISLQIIVLINFLRSFYDEDLMSP
jgi:hypothetical protein